MNREFILPLPDRRPDNAEDRVLPLINVVFLLLIFFMIAGKLIPEPPFRIDPATTGHAAAEKLRPAYLAVAADGRLAWQGKAIEREALGAALAERPAPEQPLQIRADADLEASALTGLLAELRGQGIAEIQLLTRHQP